MVPNVPSNFFLLGCSCTTSTAVRSYSDLLQLAVTVTRLVAEILRPLSCSFVYNQRLVLCAACEGYYSLMVRATVDHTEKKSWRNVWGPLVFNNTMQEVSIIHNISKIPSRVRITPPWMSCTELFPSRVSSVTVSKILHRR